MNQITQFFSEGESQTLSDTKLTHVNIKATTVYSLVKKTNI